MSDFTEGRSGKKAADKKKEKQPAAADVLVGLTIDNAALFHDSGRVAYATFGPTTVKIRSRSFRLWMNGLYHHHTQGKAPNAEAVAAALSTVEAHALYQSPELPVYVRLAGHDGRVYLHLANDSGTVIEIDGDGWRPAESSPVRFLTTPNSVPMVAPVSGGKISDIKWFVNVPDDGDFALLAGWISACFLADGPFPLLVLTGQQGSAKSTTSRILKSLIDPEKVRDRCAPKDPRDLAIWAANSRLLALDNLSSLSDWLSDAFCRLATGGGFGTRTLYENDEETIFDAKRPAILNGIEDFVTRGDLLERSVILRHPAIPEGRRRLESELWAEFDDARPRLIGSILDRVAAGIRSLPTVDRGNLPRMADAAAFAVACEIGMNEPAVFLSAYRDNQGESHALVLEDSVIAPALVTLMESRDEWQGTASGLFAAIKPAGDKLPHGWPKSPRPLSGALRRLAPALAKVHDLHVKGERAAGGNRTRTIRITKGGKVPQGSDFASPCVPDGGNGTQGTQRDAKKGHSRKPSVSALDGHPRMSSDPDYSALFH